MKYRSTPEMVKRGIALLNKFYYNIMTDLPDDPEKYILKVIECWGGLFFMRPSMKLYVSDEMKQVLFRRLREQRSRAIIEIENEVRKHGHPFVYETPEVYVQHLIDTRKLPFAPRDDIEIEIKDIHVHMWREWAIEAGLNMHEIDEIFQWQIIPLKSYYSDGWGVDKEGPFVQDIFYKCPELLKAEPVKVHSGKFEEKLKMERAQAEMNDDMAHELNSLPRYTAYAKVIEEKEGCHGIIKVKIETIALPRISEEAKVEADKRMKVIEENSRRHLKKRDMIEEEIRKRQERWTMGGALDKPLPRRSEDRGDEVRRGGPPPRSSRLPSG